MMKRAVVMAALVVSVFANHAAADAPTKLTITYSQQSADELPLWIALDGGYFEKHGLAVSEQLLAAQQGIPALLTGEAQLISIGAGDSLAAAAQGAKLTYVAAYAPLFQFQLWAQPAFSTAAKLKGQKVGVPSTTGTAYIATVLALRQLGLAPSDVAITSVGTSQNQVAALIAGSIAAAVQQPPLTYEFAKRKLSLLVDLYQKRIPNLTTGLVGLQSYIAAHRPVVQEVVDGFAEGLAREKSDKAFTEQEITKHLGTKDPVLLDATYAAFRRAIDQSLPMPEADMFKAAQSVLGLKNPKVRTVDPAAMIDQSFVRTLAANETGGKP